MKSVIRSFLDDVRANELETKFMYKDKNGKLISSVPRRLYFSFLNDLKADQSITSHKFVMSNVDIYKDFRIVTDLETNERKIEVKSRIRDYVDTNYNIKYTVSEERILSDLTRVNNDDFIMNRSRKRDSFHVTNGTIDMTEVSTMTRGKMFVTYEIEVEYIGPKEEKLVISFLNDVYTVYMRFLGTANIYSVSMREQIQAFVEGKKISLVQARNIKQKDIADGAIIGNPNWSMYVTYKADGKRFMLVVHSTGIWLVFGIHQFNLIVPFEHRDTYEHFKNSIGCIFDGELVQSNKIRYFIFDCMFASGTDVRKLEYSERMKHATRFIQFVPTNDFVSIEVKETRHLTRPEEFTIVMSELLTRRKDLDYQEDGLIFIPSSEYNPGSDKLPYNKRVLSDHPDICKYKDPKFLTIDFAIVRQEGDSIILQSYDEKLNKNIMFKGSFKHPITKHNVLNNEITQSLPTGTIVEFSYSNDFFIPVKVRSDKSGPNNIAVAEAVWDDIMNPITVDDMIGNTLKFAYSDFNVTKMDLWNIVRSYGSKLVLDIGTGNLGDGGKMFNIDHIIGIEPNLTNLAEARTRIGTYKLNGKINILNTGGQDQSIPDYIFSEYGRQVDAVTMMLSLSFFWESSDTLNKLVRNISRVLKPGGVFAFMTVDGYALSLGFNQRGNILNFGEAIYINRDSHVEVVMPGTIVERQNEWLVMFDDLRLRLEREGIRLVSYENADTENIRSENTRRFKSMYSYGYFVRDNSDSGMSYDPRSFKAAAASAASAASAAPGAGTTTPGANAATSSGVLVPSGVPVMKRFASPMTASPIFRPQTYTTSPITSRPFGQASPVGLTSRPLGQSSPVLTSPITSRPFGQASPVLSSVLGQTSPVLSSPINSHASLGYNQVVSNQTGSPIFRSQPSVVPGSVFSSRPSGFVSSPVMLPTLDTVIPKVTTFGNF